MYFLYLYLFIYLLIYSLIYLFIYLFIIFMLFHFFIIIYFFFIFILLLLFCTVKSVIPFFVFSETVQLLQNDDQKEVSLRLMCCLGTAKWRLGKGSILGCELLLRFIFLIFKNFLCFAVCFFNGKKK